ncbi:hypothetical protein [Candidatus Accumulibacter phosphatis]|uniref:Uncharacterized protein n=1 Tax=Candidatus Accumulibacter phosphatis TaxID=327160 RepID=A0A5S4EID0_9PROT|nr:hypothetical protein [Candidatus Accumulibacter phosphatis]TMQ75077.1 hypothetical protein ACCUM_2026 [Candidatus Accumulibacter phosphatis]
MQIDSLMQDRAGSPSGHRLTVSIGVAAIEAAAHDELGPLVTAADTVLVLFPEKLDGLNRVLIFIASKSIQAERASA